MLNAFQYLKWYRWYAPIKVISRLSWFELRFAKVCQVQTSLSSKVCSITASFTASHQELDFWYLHSWERVSKPRDAPVADIKWEHDDELVLVLSSLAYMFALSSRTIGPTSTWKVLSNLQQLFSKNALANWIMFNLVGNVIAQLCTFRNDVIWCWYIKHLVQLASKIAKHVAVKMHFEIPRRLYLFKKGILDEIYLLFFPPDLCSFLLSPSSPCWLSSYSLHGSLTSFSSHWIIGSLTSFPCLKKGAPTSGLPPHWWGR